MTKLIVLDQALSIENSYQTYEYFFIQHKDINVNTNWMSKDQLPGFIEPLILEASRYYDLRDCIGFEWWCQSQGSRPARGWHYDLDDKLWNTKRQIQFPLCSIIYYPLIQDLQGGHFITEDITVTPRTNRAIIMAPGTLHDVEAYVNGRYAVLINPWNYQLQ
jgi:hypothetical protein